MQYKSIIHWIKQITSFIQWQQLCCWALGMIGCCCCCCCCPRHWCRTCGRTGGWMAVLVGVNGLTDAAAIYVYTPQRVLASRACCYTATTCDRRTVNVTRQLRRRSNFEVRRCERAASRLLCRPKSGVPAAFPRDFSCVLASTFVPKCLFGLLLAVRRSMFTTRQGVVRKLEWSVQGRVRGHGTLPVELRDSQRCHALATQHSRSTRRAGYYIFTALESF